MPNGPRVVMMAEMHGRDLLRRHVVLALLVALPLAFYFSSDPRAPQSVSAGGVGMAFAIAGATFFSALSSDEVDQRLVLGGYRPVELLVGRLMFLGPLGLLVAVAFTAVMSSLSHPADPWVLLLGVCVVALQSIPLGLAVAAGTTQELEGTLVIIGIVGIQMAADPSSIVAKVLPFHGAQALITTGVEGQGVILDPLIWTALYGVGLMLVARLLLGSRLDVVAHRTQAEHPTE